MVRGISGTVKIDRNETRWFFTPSPIMEIESLRIDIGLAIEDLAGNRIDRPFDIDTTAQTDRPSSDDIIKIPFRIP
jgi:hypothetical protein